MTVLPLLFVAGLSLVESNGLQPVADDSYSDSFSSFEEAGENDRGSDIPDPDDSDSWAQAIELSTQPSLSFPGVFGQGDSYDYYRYTASKFEALAFVVSSSYVETINFWINSVSGSGISYPSNLALTYSTFQPKLAYVKPNDVVYIKIDRGSSTNHVYGVSANNNPNLSGASVIKNGFGGNHSTYYSQNPANGVTIKYRIDSSCNISLGSTGHTFADAYEYALYFWNHVGNGKANLQLVTSGEDVLLKTASTSVLDPKNKGTIGLTHYYITDFPIFWNNFYATDCSIDDNYYRYGSYEEVLTNAIHEVGHSLALSHCSDSCPQNLLRSTIFAFGEWVGDGDVASYLEIYG